MLKILNTLFLSCVINIVILSFKMKELRVKELKYLTLSLIVWKGHIGIWTQELTLSQFILSCPQNTSKKLFQWKFIGKTFYNSHVIQCANDLELKGQDLNALRQAI